MKQAFARLAVFGIVASGALGIGTLPSAACIPGSTDCPFLPPYTLESQPGYNGSGRTYNRQPDRVLPDQGRAHRVRPRRDRGHRRVYRPRNDGVFFDFYVDRAQPRYRYEEPRYVRPRYRAGRLSQAHINWCHRRYRTYREWDNTYKPTVNTRRQCVSPYI